MIVALLLGREGSIGFPGKNLYPVLGRPLMEYPLMAASNAKYVDEVYISTDSDRIKEIGRKHGAFVIDRPAYLCTKEALGEDAFVHGYKYIKETVKKEIELVVLLFCNAPTVTSELIDKGIRILREHAEYDSAVSVSCYNMWSPLRTRKIGEDGLLHPFVPFEVFGDPKTLSCDRDSQGDVWFADMGTSIIRPRCLEHIEDGLLPQKWMGHKIYPLKQWGGLDVDYEWQIPQIEYWLQKHGFK
jgi:molybdopterin-guanine dinucleotide biosynthesis protein A